MPSEQTKLRATTIADWLCFLGGFVALGFVLRGFGLMGNPRPISPTGDVTVGVAAALLTIFYGHFLSKRRWGSKLPPGSKGTLIHLGLIGAYFAVGIIVLFGLFMSLVSLGGDYIRKHYD